MYWRDLSVTLHCISYIHISYTGVTDVTVTDVTWPYVTNTCSQRWHCWNDIDLN